MKLKIAILIVFTQFYNITQEGVDKLKYGPDKELCNEKLSIYTEFINRKIMQMHMNHGGIYLIMHWPKNIYLHGPKIIKGILKNKQMK